MDAEYLKSLLDLSEASSKQIDTQVKIFEETFKGVIKNAPENDRNALEKMQALTAKAISLAKQGRQTEAQDVLNQIQNECKSN